VEHEVFDRDVVGEFRGQEPVKTAHRPVKTAHRTTRRDPPRPAATRRDRMEHRLFRSGVWGP
jgi:hypothetical protein